MLCRLTEHVTTKVLAEVVVLFTVPSLCCLQVEACIESQPLSWCYGSKGLKHNDVWDFTFSLCYVLLKRELFSYP